MSIIYNNDNGKVVMEEYDLHNFVIEMLGIESDNAGRVVLHSIEIDWRDYQPTDEETDELAKAIDKAITAINELDCLIHDIAEYTC